MEEERGGRGTGKECHVSFGREMPAGKAKALSLCGDRCNWNAPHFSSVPYCRHAHVGSVTRVTNFQDAPIGCFFDSEGEGQGKGVFHGNGCFGMLPRVLSSE